MTTAPSTPGADRRGLDRRPLFTVVTVTYRSHQGAEECLRTMLEVARQMTDELSWVFVDNSEDLSDARWFAENDLPDNVRVLESSSNPGFAASCNRGVLACESRWVLFVNPDISVDVASLQAVLTAVRGDASGAGSYAVGQETGGRRHLGIGLLWGIWFVDRSPDARSPLVGPSGGFAVVDREAFLGVGGFDETLFAWGEDVDLALRLDRAGVRCRPVPTFFPHLGGHSFVDDRALRARKVYLLARNRQHVAMRHFSLPKVVLLELMVAAVTMAKGVTHVRAGTLGAVLRGNVAGLRDGARERRSSRRPGRAVAS